MPIQLVALDLAGPLLLYHWLRQHGADTTTALLVAAALPALGVLISAGVDRHLDLVGLTVLSCALIGSVAALVVHSPRPVLLFSSVLPSALFGSACLLSVPRRPLIFDAALSFQGGPRTARGDAWRARWDAEPGFRRYFRHTTTGWGVAYLAEAAIKAVAVFTLDTGSAFVISQVLFYVVAVGLVAWMILYARHAQREPA